MVEVLSLPPDLSEEDLCSAIELHIETDCPFQPEQVRWGYLRGEDDQIWVLVLPRTAAQEQGFDETSPNPQIHWAAVALKFHRELQEQEDLRMELDPDTTLILLHSSNADQAPEVWLLPTASVDPFLSRKANGDRTPSRWNRLSPENPSISTAHRFRTPDGREVEIALTDGEIWNADLRPREQKLLSRTRAVWHRRLTFALYAGFAGLILGGLGHLMLFLLSLFPVHLPSDLQELRLQAREVEESQKILISLRQITGDRLRPFELLSQINQVRPDEITLTQATVRQPRELRLSGNARDVAQVNRFFEEIRGLPQVSSVSEPKPELSPRGEVTFNFTIWFTDPPHQNGEESSLPNNSSEPLADRFAHTP